MYGLSLKYGLCQKITAVQNLYVTASGGILVTAEQSSC